MIEAPARDPKVAVVVLTYKNEDEAADCVDSLLASSYGNLEIVLVDNDSPDDSQDRLRARFPNIVHVQSGRNGGYTAGNNCGIERALRDGAEYVMVLNDDTVMDRECVTQMLRALEETKSDVVVPQIVYYDEPDTVWYAGGVYSRVRAMPTHLRENQPVDPADARKSISFVCGCCFLARADVFRRIGGFDETYFTYVEDLEFSVRAQQAGLKLLYEPSARLLHRIGRQAPPTPRQIVLRDTNRRRMVARHYGAGERVAFALWFYTTRAVHFARYLVTGDRQRLAALVAGTFGAIGEGDGTAKFA